MTNLETLLLAMLGNKGGGGEGGTTNYNELDNRPQVNGITLTGNKDSEDLNLVDINMIGVSYGVAALDGEGKVPESQLPPYPNYDTEIQNINKALDDKVSETELLSTISASSTTQIRDSKTVEFDGTGKNLEKLVIEGKTVQDGTPSPSAPVEVKGVGDKTYNILPVSPVVSTTINGITFKSDGKGTYSISGTATADASYTFPLSGFKLPKSISNGGTGCINSGNAQTYASSKVVLAFAKGTTNAYAWSASSVNRFDSTYTFINGMTENDVLDGFYIIVKSGNAVSETYRPMVTANGKTNNPFVLYGYQIPISVGDTTKNVYLDAPLFGGEKADLVSGVADKKWGIMTFDGTQVGSSLDSSNNYRITIPTMKPGSRKNGYCDKFVPTNSYGTPGGVVFGTTSNVIYFTMPNEADTTSIDTVNAWFAANPTTIVYPLAAETKEPFDGVEIPTTVGKNTLSVDTDVTPASISVTSFGEYYSKAQIDKMFAETIFYGNVISSSSVWNGGWLDSSSYINVYYKPYTKQVIIDIHLKPSKTWNASTIGTEAKSLFFLPSDVPIPTVAIRCDVISSGYTVLLSKNNINSVGALLLLSGELDDTKDVYGRMEYTVI